MPFMPFSQRDHKWVPRLMSFRFTSIIVSLVHMCFQPGGSLNPFFSNRPVGKCSHTSYGKSFQRTTKSVSGKGNNMAMK